MPLNLKTLGRPSDQPLIEPRDIFAALGNRPWPRLRVEQDQVLKAWHRRRTERDIVIKQNTGGGKTVVGLLVAQSSLNEGVGPTAYLTPDTYLAKQAVAEAERLGINVATNPNDRAFLAGAATLVTTFAKVVNGRSTFKLAGDPNASHIGTIIIDDAHAALADARKRFTINVPVNHDAFSKALEIFENELRRQSPHHAAALLDGDWSAPIRIPFWSWEANYERIAHIISESAQDRSSDDLFFNWPLMAPYIKRAVATISSRGLQLRTPCPPIELVQAFHTAQRRIYLTATLADDGVLVTDFGADAKSVRRPVTPERATDLGDRLILAPLALNPSLDDSAVRELALQFSVGDRDGDDQTDAKPVNVVVLVPSDKAASAWQHYADEILHVDTMKPVVDRMVAGEHIGLVVLVNKYDGVDLPGDACRLLIIDGVPSPLDIDQQREAGALAGSPSMRIRKVQRLEQGMGRGIRDAEDHCAVLLLGRDASLSLVTPSDLQYFSPATRAQIDFGERVAEQIEGEGLDAVREALSLFLDRNKDLRDASSKATAGLSYDTDGHVSPLAEARRQAWTDATTSDPGNAVSVLRSALDTLGPVEKGWYLEELAGYQHELDQAGAQQTLKAAKKLNVNVLLPTVTIDTKPPRQQLIQGQAASAYLDQTFGNGTAMILSAQQTILSLAFRPDREDVEAAEAAMKEVGLIIGLTSIRPEKELSVSSPDVCWGLTSDRNAVIELKTGTTRADAAVSKDEANQLAGSVNWNLENGGPHDCIPVLVAREATFDRLAASPPGTRVITPAKLELLKSNLEAFIRTVADNKVWQRPEEVGRHLKAYHLDHNSLINHHSVRPNKRTLGK